MNIDKDIADLKAMKKKKVEKLIAELSRLFSKYEVKETNTINIQVDNYTLDINYNYKTLSVKWK